MFTPILDDSSVLQSLYISKGCYNFSTVFCERYCVEVPVDNSAIYHSDLWECMKNINMQISIIYSRITVSEAFEMDEFY